MASSPGEREILPKARPRSATSKSRPALERSSSSINHHSPARLVRTPPSLRGPGISSGRILPQPTRPAHPGSRRARSPSTAETDAAPIARGWESFALRDEPYIHNYFGPNNNQLLPGAFAVATSMLPPESPKREIIAWGTEREDSGRGFGVTMPHFYRSWEIDPLRKMILNGIVWTAKTDVPSEGVVTTLPPLETFEPESVDVQPRNSQ